MKPFLIPQCDHALLLVNKAALVMMQDKDCEYSPMAKYMVDRGHILYKAKLLLAGSSDYQRLSPAYVTLRGRSEYLFTVARCGRCALCRSSRRYDLVQRAEMESASWQSVPYMITLTYDEKHLPKDKSLNIKHLQDFFKRLRIAWTRRGIDHEIRYLACGEYGVKGRPHYHIILWNNPFDADEIRPIEHKMLCRDVFDAWSQCQPQAFDCAPASAAAGSYVTKYLTKQLVHRAGHGSRRAPFISSSIGHGGLGSRLIDSHRDFYRLHAHLQEFSYRSYDGVPVKIPITSYIRNRLYPTPSRQIAQWYKNRLKDVHRTLEVLVPAGVLHPNQVDETMRSLSMHYLMIPKIESLKLPDCWLARSLLISRMATLYNSCLDEMESYARSFVPDLTCDVYSSACSPRPDQRGNLAFKILRVTQDVSRCQCREWLD